VRLLFGNAGWSWRAIAGLAILSSAWALGGCNETAADISPSADQPQFVRRTDASMAGATVAIMSIEGAPDAQAAAFQQSLDQAAQQRQIAVVPPTSTPRYLARGYLSAGLIKEGATVDVVWDVFTPDKQRAQRLSDTIAVRGSGDDPWAMVDSHALATVAAKSADDLAAYLSNTPEAAPGGALSYAQ
jgi:hypothetical protein